MDALLAAGLGDIGELFPDTDPHSRRFSMALLERFGVLATTGGGSAPT
jgi:2C-methyl-D-erythritol 2,4-cyclodiphosphate synthase